MHALRVLEFDQIKELLQRNCETSLGAALAAELHPSFEEDEVWHSLGLTSEAYEAISKYSPPGLGPVRDIRQGLNKASKGAVLNGTEIFAAGDALSAMRSLKSFLEQRRVDLPKLSPFAESLPEARQLEDQIFASLDGDGTIKDSASATLSTLRQKKKAQAARIVEKIQGYTTGRSRELLSDPIFTVRDGRYVIPLKAENRGKIRGIVHDTSGSGQTIFIEPEDVLQLGNQLRETEAAERDEELRILTGLSAKVGAVASEAITGIELAAQIDLCFAKARLGFDMRGTLPQRQGRHFIKIQQGRHPLLEPESVVPLDISVSEGHSVLITGPNTGGKTVAIKCVGLFVLMAQAGLMVPALDVRFGPFAQVWADIGDEQSLQQSLSTFSGHIKNIGEALRHLRPGALVLLDEVGAGTDPAEGAALAKAILTEMSSRGATILASTHYGELKAFAYNTEGFENAAMEFDSKTLRPTYRLIMGAPGASHALKIAERHGIPKLIVEQAREGLGEQQQDVALMLERLEQSQRQARIAQGEADRRAEELKRAEAKANKKLAEAEEIRRTAHSKAHEIIEAALREIRLEAARVFEELKRAPHDPKATEKARQSLKELDSVGRDFAAEFTPKPETAKPSIELKKGMAVKIEGYAQSGVLVDGPRDGSAVVQIGVLKMTVPVNQVQPVEKPAGPQQRAKTNIRLQKALSASSELHLRHMRAEEAERDLEKFLDDALLAGLPTVRIVHGKGEGVLRKVTQNLLRRHPGVASYRDGEPAEGGHGVTIATLK